MRPEQRGRRRRSRRRRPFAGRGRRIHSTTFLLQYRARPLTQAAPCRLTLLLSRSPAPEAEAGKQFTSGYWPALDQLARLTEETGEVATELNHIHGTKKKKSSEETKELADELSDVIFTVICIANSHNINLEEAWKKMVDEKTELISSLQDRIIELTKLQTFYQVSIMR